MRGTRWIGIVAVGLLLSGIAPVEAASDATVEVIGYVRPAAPGVAIGGETNPPGWLVSHSPERQPMLADDDIYLEYGARLAPFEGRLCRITGVLTPDALSAGGVETPLRLFDSLAIETIAVVPGLAQRIRDDLAERGIEYLRDGTDAPSGGLTADGVCADGRLAALVPLRLPPPGGADFFTDIAFVCADCDCYWSHRTGGFAGVDLWVGPFALPAVERGPSKVLPRALRVHQTRAVTRRLTIVRRHFAGRRVKRADYAPEDFDLGDGVTVLRVLRANGRRIRLRVRIEPTATLGERDVSLHGMVGDDLFVLRPPRRR